MIAELFVCIILSVDKFVRTLWYLVTNGEKSFRDSVELGYETETDPGGALHCFICKSVTTFFAICRTVQLPSVPTVYNIFSWLLTLTILL